MKKGITISILAITVVLMFILATTATVIGVKSIQTASYEEFLSQLSRVSNSVNKYFIDNRTLPIKSQIVAKEGLPVDLLTEITNNQDELNNLFVLDMTKIRVESVNIGKGNTQNMNVFVVAENTNNIYYLKGVKYKGKTYFGIPIETSLTVIEE